MQNSLEKLHERHIADVAVVGSSHITRSPNFTK
jgi:hypothetical protein